METSGFTYQFYRSLFKRLAPFYDIVDALSLGSTAHQRRLAVQYAAIKPGGTVADLMCGTGNNARYALKAGAGLYVGIDAAAEMMTQGPPPQQSAERITYRQADLTKPMPQPVLADHIVSTYGLKCLNFSDYGAFAQVIDQMLEPGGTVSILEFRLPPNRLFRMVAKFYVSVFCGLICLLLKGRWPPTRELYLSMTPDIDPLLMARVLVDRGFEIIIKERPLGSAVLIYGRKK